MITPEAPRLPLQSDLNIKNINQIYAEISSALSKRPHLSLELREDAAVDLSFVQLVIAARAHARGAGGQVSLVRAASANLLTVLQRGGFLQDASAEDLEFWLHQENSQ